MSLDALHRRVLQVANGFADLGVGASDRVAILMRNGLDFVEATLAAKHLGAYAVPINWHGVAVEVGHVLRDCGATVLAADPRFADAVCTAVPEQVRVVTGGLDWGRWRGAYPECRTAPAAEVPSMIYTSGTTGHPKGVARATATVEQRERMATIRTRLYGIRPDMRALVAAPLYHSAPNFFSFTVLQRGGSLILHERFDAETLLATIAAERITHVFLVPTMFVRLLRLPAEVRARYDLSSLEVAIHAGSACANHVKAAMITWWGPIIQEYYGSTELGAVTFCTNAEWLARPGTVGRAVDPYRITIHDETGAPVPTGEAGEIWVEASGLPDFTYHGDPAKRAAMQRGAALASGDIGCLDEDGYLFIRDRQTDVIIAGGVNIYPAEIEAAILAMPGVADCAVFGVPDTEFGEAVVAAVLAVPGETITVSALLTHLEGRIARYKHPRHIVFPATLPREESGKIFKRRLRDTWSVAG